jgi:acetyl-CoA carboxylase biotin carboxyl carrier protein
VAARGTRRAAAPDAAAPDAAGPVEHVRGDAHAMRRLSEAVLPALIARFEASGLGELEVRRGEWRIRLRKPAGLEAVTDPVPAPAPGGRAALLAAVGPGRGTPAGGISGGGAGRRIATSPAVGYFMPLAAAAPGRVVRAGDVLGHVDVLGVRQEVVAPTDGAVSRVLAEVGQAVEYGQELVRLDATARPREGSGDGSLTAPELPLSEA